MSVPSDEELSRLRECVAATKSQPLLVTGLPLIFGNIGLLLCGAYESQRSGLFMHSCYALDRFIQYHLGGVAAAAALCSLGGLMSGLLFRRNAGRKVTFALGVLISLIGLVWPTLFLSL